MYDTEITTTAAQHIKNLCEILKDYVENTDPEYIAENSNIIKEIADALEFMKESEPEEKWTMFFQDFAEVFIIKRAKTEA